MYPKNLIEYPSGTLWLATTKGLFSVDIATGANKPFQQSVTNKNDPSPDNRLIDVIRNDSSHLLVAGASGAYRFDISSGHFKKLVWHFPGLDSAGQQQCYCIQQINHDAYIGTSAGLVVYNLENDKSSVIGSKEGITKVYHSRLKKDAKNNLWIFTSHGLFKYDPHDQSFQEYTTGDGIYDFNEDRIGIFEYDKQFYIGYRSAMTSFDPLAVNVNQTKISPDITDISVNNKALAENIDSFATHTLMLSYRQNDITFNFTGANFTNSDKITFAHQLQGYDKDWIYSGTLRAATYTNLKGGYYTFKVKARNSSGLWNEKEQVVKIKIATPFWQTNLFYLLIAILVCFIAWMMYRYRVNRLIELYKVRDTISKNLHDEIGATLSSINIYSDVARKKNTVEKETSMLMERIYKASGQVMESMNDIVWYVNPKNDSWDNIIVRMREYAIPLLEAKDIIPDFTIDESLLKYKLTMQQRQHVYFIFKEAINNIVKYAGAKMVIVKLARQEKNISLVIRDDGKGFDKEGVRTGNGLTNMQQRAARLKGQLIISSKKGEGTLIQFLFPIA